MNRGSSKTPEIRDKIDQLDWNFDGVPDRELVACCYWEYARESAFLVELRRRSWVHWLPLHQKGERSKPPEDKTLYEDLRKVQLLGYPMEVFIRGMSFPPDEMLTDSPTDRSGKIVRRGAQFPKPWQASALAERASRARTGDEVTQLQM